MQIKGKEITDECSRCGKVLECELFLVGHGLGQERDHVTEMLRCQIQHRRERETQHD